MRTIGFSILMCLCLAFRHGMSQIAYEGSVDLEKMHGYKQVLKGMGQKKTGQPDRKKKSTQRVLKATSDWNCFQKL